MLAAGGLDIADAFSTNIFAGNGGLQTITSGIDLSGEGGLVWAKIRTQADAHFFFDTERGTDLTVSSDSSSAAQNNAGANFAFSSTGHSINNNYGSMNFSGRNYVHWTFRKAPKFFDVVTYTGTGSATTVAHGLGGTVGSIIIKRTDTTSNWAVYHRSNTAAPETDYLSINLTNATADDATYWNDTAPTDSVFTVGTNAAVNASGGTYVAYLFAHDTDDDGVVQCGSYTGNGSATGPVITLGWEPQWLLIKQTDGGGNWLIYDNQRSPSNPMDDVLLPNDPLAEYTQSSYGLDFTATGFQLKGITSDTNTNGGTYIYMAIRKEGA
jgi:hypothetical protein